MSASVWLGSILNTAPGLILALTLSSLCGSHCAVNVNAGVNNKRRPADHYIKWLQSDKHFRLLVEVVKQETKPIHQHKYIVTTTLKQPHRASIPSTRLSIVDGLPDDGDATVNTRKTSWLPVSLISCTAYSWDARATFMPLTWNHNIFHWFHCTDRHPPNKTAPETLNHSGF